jgi:hypothetical protein
LSFPGDIVVILKAQLSDSLGASVTPTMLGRPLRPSDPHLSIGIYSVDWRPDQYELGQFSPATANYEYRIEVLVKDADEERGRTLHGNYAKSIRTMLYEDADLKVALAQASDSLAGTLERVQRWGVRQQRFLNNEVDGKFLYLASTEFFVGTETVTV